MKPFCNFHAIFILFLFIVAFFAAGCAESDNDQKQLTQTTLDDSISNNIKLSAVNEKMEVDPEWDGSTDYRNAKLWMYGQDRINKKGFISNYKYKRQQWETLHLPVIETDNARVKSIVMTGPSTGWAVVYDQVLSLTEEEGWHRVELEPFSASFDLNDIAAVSPAQVYAVGSTSEGWEYTKPLILEYDGISWTPIVLDIPQAQGSVYLESVSALPDGRVWAAGYMVYDSSAWPVIVEKSATGWSQLDLPAGYEDRLTSISVSDEAGTLHIWAIGREEDSYFYFNGTSWSLEPIPYEYQRYYNDVDSLGSMAVFVGPAHDILINDGGQWQSYQTSWIGILNEVAIVASNDIYAVGYDDYQSSLVLHFDGTAWSKVDLNNTGADSGEMNCVDFFDADHGWFNGYDNDSDKGYMLDLTNGNLGTAMPALIPDTVWINDMEFFDNSILVIGSRQNGDSFEAILDNGQWNLSTIPNLHFLHGMATSSLGTFAINDYTDPLLERRNGNWNSVDISHLTTRPYLWDIEASDDWVVAVGYEPNRPIILGYDGNEWTKAQLPLSPVESSSLTTTFESVSINEDFIWVAGYRKQRRDDFGIVYYTETGFNGEWKYLDLGNDEEYFLFTVSTMSNTPDHVLFGGMQTGTQQWAPLLYEKIGVGTPQEMNFNWNSEYKGELVSLVSGSEETNGLILEHSYSFNNLTLFNIQNSSLQELPTTGLPLYVEKAGLAIRP